MEELILPGVALCIVALLALVAHQNYFRFHKPQITTRYQAVTLINGDVFYGRIAHLGSNHPVLRDAMTIESNVGSKPQQPRLVVKRLRDGAHGADHIIFPVSAILRVEPVQPGSPIGHLIEQR